MPTARRYVGMAVLDGKLYAAGGETVADGATSNLVERYDFETKAWEAVAPMAEARKYHAVAIRRQAVRSGWAQRRLPQLGGAIRPRDERQTNTWEAVAPMAAARFAHGMAVLEGKLYAVGGFNFENGGHLSSVERYDPALDAWEAVAPTAVARNHAGVPVLDGKLYAVGGYDGDTGGPSSSVERYDPATNAWEAVAALATARFAHGIVVA